MLSLLSRSTATGSGEAAEDLVGVVDPPLQASEGTDHENTCAKTVPKTLETDFAVDLLDLLTSWLVAGLLVQDGDHGVGRVGNDSAEDASPVAGHESDHQLSGLAVLRLGLREDVLVEGLHRVLECAELDHSVRDLSSPEWADTLVETVPAFSFHNDGPSLSGSSRELAGFGGLHAHFELKSES